MEEALYSSYRSWNYYLPGLLLISLIYWTGNIRLFILCEFLYLLAATLHRRASHYTLLKDRVVLKQGLIRPVFSELPLGQISEIRVRQGTLGSLCDYGHLEFRSPSGEVLLFKGVRDPEELKKRVMDLRKG